MKRNCVNVKKEEKEYPHIPFLYIVAFLITLFEILLVIGIVVALCYYVPYFYLAQYAENKSPATFNPCCCPYARTDVVRKIKK